MLSGKWRPFCLVLNVLNISHLILSHLIKELDDAPHVAPIDGFETKTRGHAIYKKIM